MAARRAVRKAGTPESPDGMSPEQFSEDTDRSELNSEATQTSASSIQPIEWPQFIKQAAEADIVERFSREVRGILAKYSGILSSYTVIALFDEERSISGLDASMIYNALKTHNPNSDKDVLLLLLSNGGTIEPAYQISKLCKSFSKSRFVVAIPRASKSAATLIALGADEIHMGPLGQLGPIDPQIGGLPALGVAQALKTIASISEEHPGSAEMLARYLQLALTVEQIGYCERIGESAVQYACRLLGTKPGTVQNARKAAHDLVYEYKHHGFVIDLAEAREHLGEDWIKGESPELEVTEEVYSLFEYVNIFLRFFRGKRLLVVGDVSESAVLFDVERSPGV